MFMSLISQILCAWFAFLIPCYSTWKALSHRPTSDPELERWAMYWVCIGGLVALENVAQWLLSWIPFYWEVKTILLLFLALPQIQGSTFIYQTYVQPFFRRNETDIDAAITAAQTNVIAFIQEKLTSLWEAVWKIATKNNPNAAQAAAPGAAGGQQPQGQSSAPPAASVFAMGQSLFHTYGASAFGALQRQFAPSQAQPAAPSNKPSSSPNSSAGVQPRPPIYSSSSGVSGTSAASRPSSHSSNTPPAFPEPYHF
ncbi:TB2/DP1, HVA22 family-domain-containing protein [Irpex rosettiformis]|uniref:TB2/DP1, HVA22 family-domain-containing protein n=1 Tax=Irpex rosettiformis TaxID=378272 RepID=A0ACB8UIV9_9APHY|nr:TB2/DP1, HVA22 family-domain-containing protein [Irpex rosettiformis]